MIASGELDIGFMSLCEKHRTGDEYQIIKKEEFFLAVPSEHPVYQETSCGFAELELSKLRYEPFAQMYKGSTVREFTDEIFRQESFFPTILFETTRPATILGMIAAKMCCGLVPGYYVDPSNPDVRFFTLPSHPTWDIAVSYKKGSYLNQATKYFIRLAGDYWNGTDERM